jgi:hypothetical protein
VKTSGWFRNRAAEMYQAEGEIEIDRHARVSVGETDGAYVQAWVWVPIESASKTPLKQKRTNK